MARHDGDLPAAPRRPALRVEARAPWSHRGCPPLRLAPPHPMQSMGRRALAASVVTDPSVIGAGRAPPGSRHGSAARPPTIPIRRWRPRDRRRSAEVDARWSPDSAWISTWYRWPPTLDPSPRCRAGRRARRDRPRRLAGGADHLRVRAQVDIVGRTRALMAWTARSTVARARVRRGRGPPRRPRISSPTQARMPPTMSPVPQGARAGRGPHPPSCARPPTISAPRAELLTEMSERRRAGSAAHEVDDSEADIAALDRRAASCCCCPRTPTTTRT